jgi:hypothetical protein
VKSPFCPGSFGIATHSAFRQRWWVRSRVGPRSNQVMVIKVETAVLRVSIPVYNSRLPETQVVIRKTEVGGAGDRDVHPKPPQFGA